MATVRITEQVKYSILNHADNMFDKITSEGKQQIQDRSELIYAHIYPEEIRTKMEVLPEKFFSVVDSTAFILSSKELNFSVTIDLRFSGGKRFGYHHRAYSSDPTKQLFIDEPDNAVLKAVIYPVLKDMADNDNRRKVMKNHLTTLMQKNRTVGLCVKAWPQFVEVLPSHIKEKHFEVTEKATREETQLTEEEIAIANATLMAGKILGA